MLEFDAPIHSHYLPPKHNFSVYVVDDELQVDAWRTCTDVLVSHNNMYLTIDLPVTATDTVALVQAEIPVYELDGFTPYTIPNLVLLNETPISTDVAVTPAPCNVLVASDVDSYLPSFTPVHKKATLSGIQMYKLLPGNNVMILRCTAEDRTTYEDYVINVFRLLPEHTMADQILTMCDTKSATRAVLENGRYVGEDRGVARGRSYVTYGTDGRIPVITEISCRSTRNGVISLRHSGLVGWSTVVPAQAPESYDDHALIWVDETNHRYFVIKLGAATGQRDFYNYSIGNDYDEPDYDLFLQHNYSSHAEFVESLSTVSVVTVAIVKQKDAIHFVPCF